MVPFLVSEKVVIAYAEVNKLRGAIRDDCGRHLKSPAQEFDQRRAVLRRGQDANAAVRVAATPLQVRPACAC